MDKELLKWVPKEQVMACGGRKAGAVLSIEIDSRRVKEGALFCAIKGEHVDSHRMIEAIRNKLAAIVVERHPSEIENLTNREQLPSWVQVKSSREVLGVIADAFFERPTAKCDLVGVTGTNGKTSIVSLVSEIGKAAGRLTGAIGTLGVHSDAFHEVLSHTTPEAHELQGFLAKMVANGIDLVAMEVSSHGLALHRVDGCRFKVAIYTNLTLDHLDYHRDMEDYFSAKRRLFVDFRPGVSLINIDDPYGRRLAKELSTPLVTYSVDNAEADLWGDGLEIGRDGIRGRILTKKGQEIQIESRLIGRHNVSNLLGAAGACLALGMTPKVISKGIRDFRGVAGRLERIDIPKGVRVFVDYAHTPDALERVLRTVRPITRRRLWTVFGCGGDRDRSKRPIMGRLAIELSDVAIVTNDNPRTEEPQGIVEDILGGIPLEVQRESVADLVARGGCWVELDRRRAIEIALDGAQAGDAIVIAGKGHENYQIVGKTKSHFDDREVVREWLAGRTG